MVVAQATLYHDAKNDRGPEIIAHGCIAVQEVSAEENPPRPEEGSEAELVFPSLLFLPKDLQANNTV